MLLYGNTASTYLDILPMMANYHTLSPTRFPYSVVGVFYLHPLYISFRELNIETSLFIVSIFDLLKHQLCATNVSALLPATLDRMSAEQMSENSKGLIAF